MPVPSPAPVLAITAPPSPLALPWYRDDDLSLFPYPGDLSRPGDLPAIALS